MRLNPSIHQLWTSIDEFVIFLRHLTKKASVVKEHYFESKMGIIKNLGEISESFQTTSFKARQKTQEKYIENESPGLATLRFTLDGQIARFSCRFDEKIIKPTDEISYQLSLIASMIRSHYIINDLILSGDIIEAEVLIRKQLENLARLKELDEKPLKKIKKASPKVFLILKNIPKSFYNELSEMAHFGTPRVGTTIVREESEKSRIGPSVYPFYSSNLIESYKKHSFISIYFGFWVMEFLSVNYSQKYDRYSDESIMSDIFHLAIKENVFNIQDE